MQPVSYTHLAPQGTDVYATGDGTVVQMGWQSGYGNRIVIDPGFGYQTVYAPVSYTHLNAELLLRPRRAG